jgi:hypothetical protein
MFENEFLEEIHKPGRLSKLSDPPTFKEQILDTNHNERFKCVIRSSPFISVPGLKDM